VLTTTVMLVTMLSTLINYERMEAIVIRIRHRYLRYAVIIPTKEDQEISMGRALNNVLFFCRMFKELSHFIMPSKRIALSQMANPPPLFWNMPFKSSRRPCIMFFKILSTLWKSVSV